MADTTVSVIAGGGGDYTTVTAALAASDVTSGSYIVQIQDNSDYSENLDMLANTGTPTTTNRLVLEAAAANRHAGVGVATSGTHARILTPSSGGQCILIKDDFVVIRDLELRMDVGVSSIMGTDISSDPDHLLVSNCVFTMFNIIADAFFLNRAASGATRTLYFDHCVFDAFQICIEIIHNTGASSAVTNLYLDYCVMRARQANADLLKSNFDSGSEEFNCYMHNCFFEGTPSDRRLLFQFNSVDGDAVALGAGNAYTLADFTVSLDSGSSFDTDLTTDYQQATGDITTTTTTADAMIVAGPLPGYGSAGTSNLTPVAATGAGSNLLLGNGVARIGSEPDSFQDFSTDIAGNVRTNKVGYIDIGPFQVTVPPPGFKVWDGAAFVDSTNVQHYDGAAWVDVNGVQYWDGSVWADPA